MVSINRLFLSPLPPLCSSRRSLRVLSVFYHNVAIVRRTRTRGRYAPIIRVELYDNIISWGIQYVTMIRPLRVCTPRTPPSSLSLFFLPGPRSRFAREACYPLCTCRFLFHPLSCVFSCLVVVAPRCVILFAGWTLFSWSCPTVVCLALSGSLSLPLLRIVWFDHFRFRCGILIELASYERVTLNKFGRL